MPRDVEPPLSGVMAVVQNPSATRSLVRLRNVRSLAPLCGHQTGKLARSLAVWLAFVSYPAGHLLHFVAPTVE